MAIELLAGLIVLTIIVNEVLKKVSQANYKSPFVCRVCGKGMEELAYNWAYQLPFEIWVLVSRYNLKPQTVRRFRCVNKHTISWYLPKFGDRDCDVLVTKSCRK